MIPLTRNCNHSNRLIAILTGLVPESPLKGSEEWTTERAMLNSQLRQFNAKLGDDRIQFLTPLIDGDGSPHESRGICLGGPVGSLPGLRSLRTEQTTPR